MGIFFVLFGPIFVMWLICIWHIWDALNPKKKEQPEPIPIFLPAPRARIDARYRGYEEQRPYGEYGDYGDYME